MNKFISLLTLLLPLISIVPDTSFAHGGRLNSQGCHGGSQPYHCHRAPSEMVGSSSGGSRLTCSAGSRSQDCIGSSSSYSTNSLSSSNEFRTMLTPNYSGGSKSQYFYKAGANYWIESKEHSNAKMNLYATNNQTVGFALQLPLTDCNAFSNASSESRIKISVNNKTMPTYQQCTGFMKGNIYPMYSSDQDNFVQFFKKMRQVNLTVSGVELSFSAMGFTNAFNQLSN